MQHVLKNSGYVMVDADNYNRWQYEQFQKYVGESVLEIGCGLGNLTQFLLNDCEQLVCTDIKQEAVAFTKRRFGKQHNFKVVQRDIFTEGLKHHKQNFDTIVFSNVLEHLEDDLQAMRICQQLLQHKTGKLLLLVPAHKFLYGTLDAESGHYRRYEKKDLLALAQKSNFQVLDLYEFNVIGALGWFINYCLLKKRNTNNTSSTVQVSFFDRYLVKPGRFLESVIKPSIGISYIAILEAKR